MKTIFFFLVCFIFLGVLAFAQRTEGAHQAEINAKQNEVDGEKQPSKHMKDSRNVSDVNEEDVDSDSASNEANTSGVNVGVTNPGSSPAYQMDDGRDGTNTKTKATLNIAGSPLPGGTSKPASTPSKRNDSEMKNSPKSTANAKTQSSKTAKKEESKKKKKR